MENTRRTRASPLDNPPCDLPAYSKVVQQPDPDVIREQWISTPRDVPTRRDTVNGRCV